MTVGGSETGTSPGSATAGSLVAAAPASAARSSKPSVVPQASAAESSKAQSERPTALRLVASCSDGTWGSMFARDGVRGPHGLSAPGPKNLVRLLLDSRMFPTTEHASRHSRKHEHEQSADHDAHVVDGPRLVARVLIQCGGDLKRQAVAGVRELARDWLKPEIVEAGSADIAATAV